MGLYTEGKEILKDLGALAKANADADLREKVLDMQEKFYDLYEENQELRKINKDLLEVINGKAEVIWTNETYYKLQEDSRKYCSRCFDADNKLVATHYWGKDLNGKHKNICPNCNKMFEVESQ